MNEQYLIPANSKRSMLIFGLFEPVDLIIFSIGAVITFVMLLTIKTNTIKDMLGILTPLIISAIMVAPIPNHRNVWNFTANVYKFFKNRRSYRWKGWCVIDEKPEQK